MPDTLPPPLKSLPLAESTGFPLSALEVEALNRAPPAGLKRRRPLISGAPTRVTIASVDEPPTKRQSIADENAEILAATDVHTTLEMPAKSSIPEANIQIITACQEIVEACIVPQALPPGITVRRRKSRLAPKQVPSISKKTSSPAARSISSRSDITPHSRRLSVLLQLTEAAPSAKRVRTAHQGAVLALAPLPSPAPTQMTLTAVAPPSRLMLQLPGASGRRASVAPSAAAPPPAHVARSRQSISFFHRECGHPTPQMSFPTNSDK